MVVFERQAGLKLNHIPYKGSPAAINDVMAGHVALMFADAGSVMGQINASTVRPLGVSSLTRVPALSDVPFPIHMEPNLVVEFYSR